MLVFYNCLMFFCYRRLGVFIFMSTERLQRIKWGVLTEEEGRAGGELKINKYNFWGQIKCLQCGSHHHHQTKRKCERWGNFWVCRLRRYQRETPTEGKIMRWIDGWIRGMQRHRRKERPRRGGGSGLHGILNDVTRRRQIVNKTRGVTRRAHLHSCSSVIPLLLVDGTGRWVRRQSVPAGAHFVLCSPVND